MKFFIKWLLSLFDMPKKCPECGGHETKKIDPRIGHGKTNACIPCAIFFLLLLVVVPAFASENSLTIQGGWQHTPNSNNGDAVEFVARAEREVIENRFGTLSGGLEYAYHGPTSRYAQDNTQYGDVSGHTVMGEAIYYPPVAWKLKPYALAGAGWGWWDFSESNWSKQADITVDMRDAVCVKYAVGANYRINKDWSFNVEWAYFETDIPKNAHYSNGTFSNIMDTGATVGQAETNILFGFRRDF